MWMFYQESNENFWQFFHLMLNRINYWIFTAWVIKIMDAWIKNICSDENEKDSIILRIFTAGMSIIFSLHWGFPVLTFICYFFTCGFYPWVTTAVLIFLCRSWITAMYLALQRFIFRSQSPHLEAPELSSSMTSTPSLTWASPLAWKTELSSVLSCSAKLLSDILRNAYQWFKCCIEHAARMVRIPVKKLRNIYSSRFAPHQTGLKGILRVTTAREDTNVINEIDIVSSDDEQIIDSTSADSFHVINTEPAINRTDEQQTTTEDEILMNDHQMAQGDSMTGIRADLQMAQGDSMMSTRADLEMSQGDSMMGIRAVPKIRRKKAFIWTRPTRPRRRRIARATTGNESDEEDQNDAM